MFGLLCLCRLISAGGDYYWSGGKGMPFRTEVHPFFGENCTRLTVLVYMYLVPRPLPAPVFDHLQYAIMACKTGAWE